MRRILTATLLGLFEVLLLLPVLGTSTASAATGEVTWTNPPENTGKIKRDDDEDNGDYMYNVNAGRTNPPDYVPTVGDRVTFTPGPGNTASDVTAEDPAGDDPCNPPATPPDPVCGPPGTGP